MLAVVSLVPLGTVWSEAAESQQEGSVKSVNPKRLCEQAGGQYVFDPVEGDPAGFQRFRCACGEDDPTVDLVVQPPAPLEKICTWVGIILKRCASPSGTLPPECSQIHPAPGQPPSFLPRRKRPGFRGIPDPILTSIDPISIDDSSPYEPG
jgi:hypothetical protein